MVQTDCRHFSGYKPCSKNTICSEHCKLKEVATPRILIIHLEALGAVLRATVILRAIHSQWPKAHVTWITNPLASALLENNPYINRLLKNNHEGTLALSTLAFDYTFCVDKSLVAAGLMEIPIDSGERRGFGVDQKTGAIIPLNLDAQKLYEIGLSNYEKFYVNKKSEAQLIIESLGFKSHREKYVFEFTRDEKLLKTKERERLGLIRSKKPIIGFNTGCSPTISYKKLTVAGWCKLIEMISLKYPGSPLLLLGGPEDTQRNIQIATILTQATVIATPTLLGLRQGMIYIDMCDAVITGDSLGMHMAIALNKWTVAWFGPTCAHEIDFYDRGAAVVTEAPCSPCWKRSCDKEVMCYDQVNYDKIISALSVGLRKLIDQGLVKFSHVSSINQMSSL
ncbi:MAG: glycosyltransferase family 9 protein [Oligoflexia bacterium]|nr:glycosyltransferase family 9 protein [Oligoflexia bacterium]